MTKEYVTKEYVTKEYLAREYSIYRSDYKLATDDDGRFSALCGMKKIMEIAALTYGFEFADNLQEAYDSVEKC